MSEIFNSVNQLEQLLEGPAWHGPSLSESLSGLSGADAAAKSIPSGHSIWELVHHIAAWENVVAERLGGQAVVEPAEGNFPLNVSGAEADWADLLETLRVQHRKLISSIAELSDSDMDRTMVGKDHSQGVEVAGIINHLVYHTGQIALLRKALGDR
jgi:uncharacterized damage-inducible protein DinB